MWHLWHKELESRMKKIIDDYSPILEDVPFEDIKEKVREKTKLQKDVQGSQSQEDSLHLSDAADGEDIPVGE